MPTWKVVVLYLVLSGCAAVGQGADVLRQTTAITIYRDNGGVVGKYFEDVLNELTTTRQIRIEGEVDSAATAWLRLGDRVCAGPNARLGFHKFSGPNADSVFYVYRTLYLPPAFREWVDANVKSTEMVYMEHNEVMSYLKPC